ncbi:MAG: hypothetical protein U9O85_11115 [Euryarchaeota archaeon]|nr:hypothetical protein [Euryarchaeota archaeon]
MRNIGFNKTFMLYKNETYNYTIITGSYPQIIHETPFNATGGKITCDKTVSFITVGYQRYDWNKRDSDKSAQHAFYPMMVGRFDKSNLLEKGLIQN